MSVNLNSMMGILEKKKKKEGQKYSFPTTQTTVFINYQHYLFLKPFYVIHKHNHLFPLYKQRTQKCLWLQRKSRPRLSTTKDISSVKRSKVFAHRYGLAQWLIASARH